MNASEFKKILKPLVIQSVKEVLLQEGVLSSIVAETVQELEGRPVIEQKLYNMEKENKLKEREFEKQRQARIKKLNESNKFGDVFSGTKEIIEDSQGPLTGVTPSDSGVDIEAIEKLSNGKWKTLMGQK
jgi:hypothetical protein